MLLVELPIAAAVFLLLLVASVAAYLRSRNALTGAVVLVFAAGTPLFLVRLVDYFTDIDLPPLVDAAFLLALLAQPFLTLRLAAMLYPVAPRLMAAALVAYLATAVPVSAWYVLSTETLPPLVMLAAVAVYAITAIGAAICFALSARRRMGSARVRLTIASGATLLMAATLILAAVAASLSAVEPTLSAAARYGVLLAALAYAAAFVAPGWLRRLWQAGTAYELTRRLLTDSAEADPSATWQRFARLVAEAAGVRHAAVWQGRAEGGARPVASVGGLPVRALDGTQLDSLLSHAAASHQLPVADADPLLGELVAGASVRYLTLVRFDASRGQPGLLLLGGERRSLFAPDDRELFALLGIEAALLAGRAEAMAEQTQLAARLTETVDALRAASQAKDEFLASMSHELRTPLNAILGFSDLMRGEPETDGKRSVPASWIDHVHSAGGHLLVLINDVLDLAKIEAGRLELQIETVDARAAVADALAELRPLARHKDLEIEAVMDPFSIPADPGRFRQILYNLVSNAIKFTAPGGSIRIEGSVARDEARIAVVDTGVGIAPDDHEGVFEEFVQVGDTSRRAEGTGLGLALTRRLIEAHGGHIELESSPGKGSRFTIVLPMQAAVADGAPARMSRPASIDPASRAAGAEWSGEPPTIVVIEDDPSAAELVRTYLEPDGYRVVVARDGISGIAAARRDRPRAILLDVQLPGIDGWEVLRRLKADPQLSHIPVLMLTVVDERDIGLALGAADYLLKPIDRPALLGAIQRILPVEAGRQPRILVADDDPSALELVHATLAPHGYRIVTAGGGHEAILAAAGGGFDLIVCDLLMPDLDGFEVVAQLKAAVETRDTPVLILTAHTLDESEKTRLNGKIVGICQKGNGSTRRLREWLAAVLPAPATGGAGP